MVRGGRVDGAGPRRWQGCAPNWGAGGGRRGQDVFAAIFSGLTFVQAGRPAPHAKTPPTHILLYLQGLHPGCVREA